MGYVDAHIERGEVKRLEDFVVEFTTYPPHPPTGENVILLFSIQDLQRRDVERVVAKLTILKDGEPVYTSPVKSFPTGELFYDYVFKEGGEYTALLEVIHPGRLTVEYDFEVIEGGTHTLVDVLAVAGGGAALGILAALGAYVAFKKVWK